MICLAASACASSSVEVPVAVSSRPVTETRLQARLGGTELISQSQRGTNRICTYRARGVGSEVRVHQVGLSQRCPPHFPSSDPNLPMPPTAGLQESRVVEGERACVYVQSSARWTVNLQPGVACPLSAGLAQALLETGGEPSRRPDRVLQAPAGDEPNTPETPDQASSLEEIER